MGGGRTEDFESQVGAFAERVGFGSRFREGEGEGLGRQG